MSELRADYGDAWVQTFSGQIDANILERGLNWASQNEPSGCPVADRYNWQSIRSHMVRFYESSSSETR